MKLYYTTISITLLMLSSELLGLTTLTKLTPLMLVYNTSLIITLLTATLFSSLFYQSLGVLWDNRCVSYNTRLLMYVSFMSMLLGFSTIILLVKPPTIISNNLIIINVIMANISMMFVYFNTTTFNRVVKISKRVLDRKYGNYQYLSDNTIINIPDIDKHLSISNQVKGFMWYKYYVMNDKGVYEMVEDSNTLRDKGIDEEHFAFGFRQEHDNIERTGYIEIILE